MSLTHVHRKLPPPLPKGKKTPWGRVKDFHWDGFNRHVEFPRGVFVPDEMVREAIKCT